ncbi:two-component sensor histidine kinase [Glutamicibacter uratoxydans]|uniref:Two-component sensor histidine kinase n=1 Tax=Glutamicibacter uratoxydans TaxID=43667 RepID=A0A4Y4DNH3_GLUUR|nr:histidine kinase [Glutamicibacter uratoxydans]GED04888.1 two-component sensor histidine kinase [Glutamicibacter uratoxydans]
MQHDNGPTALEQARCEFDEQPAFWDKWGWLVSGVWIIFLIFPVLDLLLDDYPLPTRIIGLGFVVLFAAIYLRAYARYSRVVGEGGTTEARALVYYAILWAITLAGIPVIGLTAMGIFPFLTSYSAFLLTRRITIATYTVVTVLCFALPIIYNNFVDLIFLIGLNLVLMVVYAVTVAAITRSAAAEKIRADYLLVAEQERVARDVHDGIGHSLTALNLKAQLALRLMDAGKYEQARGEVQQLSELAVTALDSVRTTVHGLSRQDLDTELVELHKSCTDNHLDFTVIGQVEDIPLPWRSHVAWILREAVTNVLRHAHAGSVAIRLDERFVSVDDDGDGIQGNESGHGIRGMAERARLFGASATVGASALGGTQVLVTFAARNEKP